MEYPQVIQNRIKEILEEQQADSEEISQITEIEITKGYLRDLNCMYVIVNDHLFFWNCGPKNMYNMASKNDFYNLNNNSDLAKSLQ